MTNHHYARNPLLYIKESTTSTPVAPMQHNYYTPKHQHSSTDETPRKNTRRVPLTRNRFSKYQPIIEETIEETIEEEETDEELSEDKKFRDMTIRQKVDYFINRSDHAPIIRSEIQTNEKKYQGVITGFENDHVFIRIGRRSTSSEVPFHDITDIRIIGF